MRGQRSRSTSAPSAESGGIRARPRRPTIAARCDVAACFGATHAPVPSGSTGTTRHRSVLGMPRTEINSTAAASVEVKASMTAGHSNATPATAASGLPPTPSSTRVRAPGRVASRTDAARSHGDPVDDDTTAGPGDRCPQVIGDPTAGGADDDHQVRVTGQRGLKRGGIIGQMRPGVGDGAQST